MANIFGPEDYDGGAVDAAITAANTAHAAVGDGWTFANDPAAAVGLSAKYARVDVGAATTSYMQASFTGEDIVVARMYVRLPAVPTTGSVDLATVRAGATLRARLGLVDGKLVLRNGSTVVWTSTAAPPAQSWFRLEWRLDNSLGEQQLRVFRLSNQHGTTADEDSGARTLTTGGEFTQVRFGPANNALTTAWTAYYDATVISDVTWPGPAYTPPVGGPVSVNAGGDQLAVEPWSPVTLAATASGSVTGWAWRQLEGPRVTLSGADTATVSFAAPATLQGVWLQFEVSATYAGGTAPDTVNVTVRAVTERAVIGGREVPMRVLNVVDVDPLTWAPDTAWSGGQTWG